MSSLNFPKDRFPDTEKALNHFVNGSMTGILIVGEDKQIEYVNDLVYETLGYSSDELIGSDFDKFLHPDCRECVDIIYTQRRSGNYNVRTYDAKVQGKDGTFVDVQVCSTAINLGPDNIKILAQVLDRTDVEKNRQALESFEKRHQVLVETMNEGLGVIDDSGALIFANGALCELTGYHESELCSMVIGDLLHGLDVESIAEKVSQRRIGMKDRYEASLIHRSRTKIPVMISASPLFDSNHIYSGSIAVFTDLSQVYEGQRQLTQLFDAFSDPAFLWKRTPEGEIVLEMMNEPMHNLSNSEASDQLGKTLQEILHGSPELVSCVEQVFIDGNRQRIELPFEGHSGLKRWFIWDLIRHSNDIVLMIAIDITHRIKSEKKLQKVNQRALFYMDLLQHDVRNKLQEIQGYTELAVNQTENYEQAHFLNYVLAAISECTDLISKTSTLEKLMEMPLSKVLLSEAIFSALKNFKDIDKIANLKISGPIVEANELLEQMFIFLIENMCNRNPSEKKRIWVNIAEKSNYHEVVLYDNGLSIPDNEIVNLFDPLKRLGGVELLIVQQIIEKFSGKIRVVNKIVGPSSTRTEYLIQLPKIE